MAKQAGLGTLVGSAQDIVGYAVDGRAYFRMKGGLDNAKWKRSPSMALSRDAARLFGAASMISAGIWKNVPREMKRIMAPGAFNRLVGACRMLVEEDGNIGDVDGFRGGDFSSCPELAALSGMRVGRPDAGFDEGLKMKDESPAACLDGGGAADGAFGARSGGEGGSGKRRFCVAEPFTGKEKPDFVVEHERLGTISAFREGLAALRAEAGRPVARRRRVWVAVCEVPTVQWVPGGKGRGAFFLVQNGRHWLGRGSSCSSWEQNSPNSPNSLNSQDSLSAFGGPGVRGLVDEALREARVDTERSEVCSGVFLVMVGVEVAEKRGRHWVRVPQMCRVRVTDVACLNQDLQDSEQNSQDLEQNSQDSQNSQNSQTRWLSGSQAGDLRSGCLDDVGMGGEGMPDLEDAGRVVELKDGGAVVSPVPVWGDDLDGLGGGLVGSLKILRQAPDKPGHGGTRRDTARGHGAAVVLGLGP